MLSLTFISMIVILLIIPIITIMPIFYFLVYCAYIGCHDGNIIELTTDIFDLGLPFSFPDSDSFRESLISVSIDYGD